MSGTNESGMYTTIEYVYRRKPFPGSREWHMNPYSDKIVEPNQRITTFDVMRSADQIVLTISVPCTSDGTVSRETHELYEDLADTRFRELMPEAELA